MSDASLNQGDCDGTASAYAALSRPTKLRDEADFIRHVEYIHYNPVKHGYMKSPIDWPYSSFPRYVEAGKYPADWGQSEMKFEGVGRE